MATRLAADLWQWLHDTSSGQATFLGALTGSVIGFLALLGGALVNAHLNRKRDDRLRREEQRAVAIALRAELVGCRRALLKNIQDLSTAAAAAGGLLVTPDLTQIVRIMPHMIPQLGLLDEETIEKVANAYVAIDEHGDQMLLFAGHLVDPERVSAGEVNPERVSAGEVQLTTRATGSRRLVAVSAGKVPRAIAINNGVVGAVEEAIDRLDVVLRGFRRQSLLAAVFAAVAGSTKKTTAAKAK
jgi:hypothetical protein